MTEISCSEQSKWAKAGNFPAFCFISPEFKSLEQAKTSFDLLRENFIKNKIEITEIEETWFDMNEFVQYAHSNNLIDNSKIYLTETMSMSSRMKLKRAAIRTAKRRARKRFMKRMIRKNAKQLKKRAYGQVKNILRKKLSGNRPWSSIPLSSRERIDKIINKRKPILNRMIKNRMPLMQRQETQRLQNLRKRSLNNSYEIPVANYLLEKNTRPVFKDANQEARELEQGRERVRRHRDSIKNDPAKFIKNVRIATNSEGKKVIIMADNITQNHKDIEEPSFSEIKILCSSAEKGNIENFHQTPTSKQICGEITKMKEKSPNEPNASDQKQTETFRQQSEQPEPAPPPNNEPADATSAEYINAFIHNLVTLGGEDLEIFFTNIQPAQTAHKRQKSKQSIIPKEEIDALERIKKIGEKHKVDKKIIETMLDKDAAVEIARKASEGISKDSMFNGVLLIPTGTQAYQNKNREKVKGKPDIFAVRVDLLDPTGKMSQSELLDALQKFQTEHATLIKKKKYTKDDTEKLIKIYNGIIRISQKTGTSRAASGALSEGADAYMMLKYVLDQPNISEKTKTEIKKLMDTMKDKITSIVTPGTVKQTITSGGEFDKARAKVFQEMTKEINNTLDSIMNDDLEAKAHIIYAALRGNHQFDENDPISAGGIATNIMGIGPDGTVKLSEITMDLAKKIAKDTKIYVSTKSGSIDTLLEQDNKRNYQILEGEQIKGLSGKDLGKGKKEFLKRVHKLYNAVNELSDIELTQEEIFGLQTSENKENALFIKRTQEYLRRNNDQLDDLDREILQQGIRPILRNTWMVVSIEIPSNFNESKFSHNPLLRLLLEINNTVPGIIDIKRKKDIEELIQYQKEIDEIQFDYIGTDLNKIMQLLDISIDTIKMDPIDISEYIPSKGDGRYNAIYVNGGYHRVPLDVSELYSSLGKSFLQENKKRNYRSEYDNYHSTKEQRKKRSRRNIARRWAERKGLVHKGDGKDVDHKNGNPMDNSPGNLRVRDRGANRADNE